MQVESITLVDLICRVLINVQLEEVRYQPHSQLFQSVVIAKHTELK